MAATNLSWNFDTVVLIVVMVALMASPSVSSNSEGDALHVFRRGLSDPHNILQSWDPTLVNPCTWFHVTCDLNNHVIRLDLGNGNISGRLAPELQKLEHLQYLELYQNDIEGTIPDEFGNFKKLISMDLYGNKISGEIPRPLGNLKKLQFLRLNNNRLTGRIPMKLTTIPNLQILDVSHNNLCGTIPTNGAFQHFSLERWANLNLYLNDIYMVSLGRCFDNNPRLRGPQLQGLVSYDSGC